MTTALNPFRGGQKCLKFHKKKLTLRLQVSPLSGIRFSFLLFSECLDEIVFVSTKFRSRALEGLQKKNDICLLSSLSPWNIDELINRFLNGSLADPMRPQWCLLGVDSWEPIEKSPGKSKILFIHISGSKMVRSVKGSYEKCRRSQLLSTPEVELRLKNVCPATFLRRKSVRNR